jgi:hypothetical protein
MTPGVLTGGWEFVRAAYGLSFLLYGVYALSVILRWKRGERS